jgi:hypothetical protein
MTLTNDSGGSHPAIPCHVLPHILTKTQEHGQFYISSTKATSQPMQII